MIPLEKEAYKDVPVKLEEYIFIKLNPCVSAVYHSPELELEENSDNPAILALPPFFSREKVVDAMRFAFAIAHNDTYRQWAIEKKILGLEHIMRVLVIMPEHLEIYDWMHLSLRHRYRDAVPTTSLASQLQRNYEASQSGHATVIRKPERSHALCRFISGLSGVGKTTLIIMVMSMFPMMIEHEEFGGVPGPFVQVVWILVSCPPTGSVETLLKGILYWFDLKLGSRNVQEMKSDAKVGDYLSKIEIVLKRHMVGAVIIDEIHFALRAADKTWVIDFLTNIFNDNCCLFVMIGTPEAERYLKPRVMRNIRRTLSGGWTVLSPFQYGQEWDAMANEIIRVDFLPRAPSSVVGVRAALYEVSAGLAAFAKLAWEIAQYVGLRTGLQEVTPELIRQSVAETFYPVAGLLDALRRRDYMKLVDFEDMATREVQKVKASLQKLGSLGSEGDEARSNIFGHCVATLIGLGQTHVDAEALIRRLMQEHPEWKGRDVLREALTVDTKMAGVVTGAKEESRGQSGGASQKRGAAGKRKSKRRSA